MSSFNNILKIVEKTKKAKDEISNSLFRLSANSLVNINREEAEAVLKNILNQKSKLPESNIDFLKKLLQTQEN